jgi:hypothetical protein
VSKLTVIGILTALHVAAFVTRRLLERRRRRDREREARATPGLAGPPGAR